MKIADYGLANFADSTQDSVDALEAGPLCPELCCPAEVWKDERQYMPTKEADVFAFGTVYYQVRTNGYHCAIRLGARTHMCIDPYRKSPVHKAWGYTKAEIAGTRILPPWTPVQFAASCTCLACYREMLAKCWQWCPSQRPNSAELIILIGQEAVPLEIAVLEKHRPLLLISIGFFFLSAEC